MPYQTGIRLLCVTQNPANGFPARLLAESPAPALRRNQWTAPLATGSTTAPVSVAGAVLCLAFGPQRPTAARSAGFGVMVALVVGPTPETLWYYGNWLQPIDAKNHPIETGGLGRAAALVPDRKLFLRPGGANSRSELL